MSRLHSVRWAFLAIAILFSLIDAAMARRAIPDDNLAYPVLITLKGGGTGFPTLVTHGSPYRQREAGCSE
jgi:hypothetical protein